ncbi:MAG: hypothetical protein QOF30_1898, partial [Acidimicrobiaceae bacterium]|nr:hypothetical protein [Acidimicrobiaceae bacterium]
MKGDFTRDTYVPTRHYSRVLMQQGRVQLDADWNEQTAIVVHYLRTLTADILGPHAGPADNCGFELVTAATAGRLGAVDGDGPRQKVLQAALAKGDFAIRPGRYYVHGIMVENEQTILYSEQLGYPFAGSPAVGDLHGGGSALAYLEVWEQLVTPVEDDHMREVALGGPDTCVRAQVTWTVKVLAAAPGAAGAACRDADSLPAIGTGRLRARARLDKAPTELCAIPPNARYRGAENQLYRVEVHAGGTAGGANPATFKWSRDNGSIVFPIRTLSGIGATVEGVGRDDHQRLKPGQWVEVLDDRIERSGHPGILALVDAVVDDFSVTLKIPVATPPATIPTYGSSEAWLHPRLRRWDHAGDVGAYGGALLITESTTSPAAADGWITVEDGVQVWFAPGGQYLTGDYWEIPARVFTGDVEWPHETDGT